MLLCVTAYRQIYTDFLKIIQCNPKNIRFGARFVSFNKALPTFTPLTRLHKQPPLIHLSMQPSLFSSVFCECTYTCTTNSFVDFAIDPQPPATVTRTDLTYFCTELVHFHSLFHGGKSRDCADLRKCNCIMKPIRLSKTVVLKLPSTWLSGKASKRNENPTEGS